MKTLYNVLFIFTIASCNNVNTDQTKFFNNDTISSESYNYVNITELFTIEDFENTKNFILDNGDRLSYMSSESNNPHYSFSDFDLFLSPGLDQNNELNESVFNEMTILYVDSFNRYHNIIIDRDGKRGKELNQVYLINQDNLNSETLKEKIKYYLDEIKKYLK